MNRMVTESRCRALQAGQGMTEYIIIVGVIAVLLIVVAYRYGGSIAYMFDTANEELMNTGEQMAGSSDEVEPN